MLYNDQKSIRGMESLVIEANRMQHQLSKKQVMIEMDQNKSLSNMSKVSFAFDKIALSQHSDYRVTVN